MTTRTLALIALGLLPMTARSDEGMWLFNAPPRDLLKSKHNFDLTDAWLKRAQLASVRFNSGGSGSFVSPGGLIVTNHHVGADALQKLSPPDKDYYRDGFLARSRDAELKCPDLELNVLQSMEDVTDRVNAAVPADAPAAKAFAARRAKMAEIEKESTTATGLRSDIVTLYNGGAYHLYRYKKYTDVRLVFAPEAGIASFGGDVDNFEYPRHGLDICIFRAYENGAPAKVAHWLKWSATGPAENDLVFVTGHPGTTNRLETVAKLVHRRDVTLPYTLARLRAMEAALVQFSERGPDERKMAATDLHSAANSRKAFAGQYQGLLDPAILKAKTDEEGGLIISSLPAPITFPKSIPGPLPPAWQSIADAQDKLKTFEREYLLLETGHAFSSELFRNARHLVRLADELPKPGPDRLREYRDSNMESLKFALFSPAPIHAELERHKLTASLTFLAEQYGGSHPLVVKVLAGKNPSNRAAELVAGCGLRDVAARRALFDGGKAAVEASNDAMVALAKLVDAESRAVRKRYEDEVEEVERQGYAKIAQARFKQYGQLVAPDATFTLRLAFGVVKGYEEDGSQIPFHTTFASAFVKADKLGNREPFALPPRWIERKAKLDLATPFNFVSTADTIGGNSGSPVLNRAGDLVGVNFDRNRHGLVRNFVYTDVRARHIAVHSRAVLEALAKVYDASELLNELTN
ncbi:MAG: S46 family peptidase [Gemmataceae bacterium]